MMRLPIYLKRKAQTMGKYADKACDLFVNGANCAQAVFAAFSEELGMEEELCLKLSSTFGGGMGRLREVCGAVSGMFMVAGVLKGYGANDDAAKAEVYALVQDMANQFKVQHSTIICRELLRLPSAVPASPVPTKRDESFYKSRPCLHFVETAALIAEKLLEE